MATADELLAMSTEPSEEVLIADLDTRVITIPASLTILGVEADDDVKVLRFNMPQYYGEFDLSKFQITVNFENARHQGDFYPIKSEDVEVTDGTMAFDWLVDRTAFMYPGDVNFNLCLKLYDEAGTIVKELNFTPATLPVLEGLETSKEVVESNPSAFDAILFRLYAVEAATGNGQNGYYSVVKVVEDEENNDVEITVIGSDGTTTATLRHGVDGEPGYVPVKGLDYYTEEDKTEFKEYINEWAPRTVTVTLNSSDWINTQQTITILGLDDDNIVIPSPEPSSASNYAAYNESAIRGVSHSGSNITFVCETVPTVDIEVNLAIFYSFGQLPGYTATQDGGGYVDVTKCGVANNGTDCSLALQELVKNGGQFYFPDGVYDPKSVLINKDTVFRLSPNAEFHSDHDASTFRLVQCSFSMYGGKITSGTYYPDRPNTPYGDPQRVFVGVEGDVMFKFYECHDCVIDGVTVPYSSHSCVFRIYGDNRGLDPEGNYIEGTEYSFTKVGGGATTKLIPRASRNMRFLNCKFDNFLESAIGVQYANENIVIDGCTFTNALRGAVVRSDGTIRKIDYGYCVCTNPASVLTPTQMAANPTKKRQYSRGLDGYVVRNCYIENCEGTGIDSHGARNVLYENNKLIDCDNFITAYWDYFRARTAEDWIVENIVVRNNWCKTTKAFDYMNNAYPHPPFMLYSQGHVGKMQNLIVENNYIETNWYYYNAKTGQTASSIRPMISASWVNNIVFRNNVIKTTAASAKVFDLSCCRNVEIDNTTLIGTFDYVCQLYTMVCKLGKFDCSKAVFTKAMFTSATAFYSVVDTDSLVVSPMVDNMFLGGQYIMNRYGRPLQEFNGILPLDGTYCAYKGFVGKKTDSNNGSPIAKVADFPADLDIDLDKLSGDNVIVTRSYRFPPGTFIRIGTNTEANAYRVVDVESFEDTTDMSRETCHQIIKYTLDRNITSTGSYVHLYDPYVDKYTAAEATTTDTTTE